jgi:hypothetical protein
MTRQQKQIVGALGAIALLVALSFIPLTVDYRHYLTTTRDWLAGETRLYDNQATNFYYMPWSLLVTAPLSMLPDRWGQALLGFTSILSILFAVRILIRKPTWLGYYVIFVNLFTINLLASGQWDGLVLGSVGLAWWCVERKQPLGFGLALTLISTKPTNIWLVMLLLVATILKSWPFRQALKSMSIPVLALIGSFWISGLDWPLRYLAYIKDNPMPARFNISFWQPGELLTVDNRVVLATIGLMVVWLIYKGIVRSGINGVSLSLALLINLIVSPYVLSYHFVGATPAIAWLAKESKYYALAIHGAMFGLFLALAYELSNPPYMLYPLSILAFCVLATLTKPSSPQPSN